jgi:hypothetical protein
LSLCTHNCLLYSSSRSLLSVSPHLPLPLLILPYLFLSWWRWHSLSFSLLTSLHCLCFFVHLDLVLVPSNFTCARTLRARSYPVSPRRVDFKIVGAGQQFRSGVSGEHKLSRICKEKSIMHLPILRPLVSSPLCIALGVMVHPALFVCILLSALLLVIQTCCLLKRNAARTAVWMSGG